MAKKKPTATINPPKPPRFGVGAKVPGFTPWKPPAPAPGSYDPALETQRGGIQRGLLDTQQDVGLAGTRATEDYGFDTGDITRASQQETDQYTRNTGLLTRRYTNLGIAQGERANAYGVLPGGGAALQSAAKRAANQAVEQGGLDLAHTQFGERATAAQGRLDVGYGRGVTDRTTSLTRAGREATAGETGITNEEAYQAANSPMGYSIPRPGHVGGMHTNERVLPDGSHVRDVTRGNQILTIDPTGKVIRARTIRTVVHTNPRSVRTP